MFVRVTTTQNQGRTYKYLRLVETYREDGQPRQRVLANLGRLDTLRAQGKIDALIQKLRRFSGEVVVTGQELKASQAPTWGPVLVARHLWDELSLPEILRKCCGKGRMQFDVIETAFVLASARLAHPSSEHGLARWLDEAYVCDSKGRRWLPQWRPPEQVTAEDRVRVEPRQLAIWYRTLDALLSQKKAIEEALYLRLRDLVGLQRRRNPEVWQVLQNLGDRWEDCDRGTKVPRKSDVVTNRNFSPYAIRTYENNC